MYSYFCYCLSLIEMKIFVLNEATKWAYVLNSFCEVSDLESVIENRTSMTNAMQLHLWLITTEI